MPFTLSGIIANLYRKNAIDYTKRNIELCTINNHLPDYYKRKKMEYLKIAITLGVLSGALILYIANRKATQQYKQKYKNMATWHLTEDEFVDKVYDFKDNSSVLKFKGDKPVIVDFFATWCGPCKRLSPIMDELGAEYEGKIDIYKIDVEQCPNLAAAFGIQSIPTLLFIPMNQEPQIAQGALPKNNLKQIIDEFLLGQ